MSNSFAVLVLSCDKYADLWPGFLECFWSNFPSGPWKIYLGSNTLKCEDPRVTTIYSGHDADWSTSYKRILNQIPEKKIFVVLEDLFISSKINDGIILKLFQFMANKDAKYIRYWANPGAQDSNDDGTDVAAIPKGAPYRSTVCGFWDRNTLLSLLIEGESPWNFEIFGSYRTSYSDGYFSIRSPLARYQNMVEKGLWIPRSLNWALVNNITINIGARPILKGSGQWKSILQNIFFKATIAINWRCRVRVMNVLRKLFASY
jgi:hypothetical protein